MACRHLLLRRRVKQLLFRASRRQLSSLLFANKADFHPLFDFLSGLAHTGQSLMLNERVADTEAMAAALDAAEQLLAGKDDEVGGVPSARTLPTAALVLSSVHATSARAPEAAFGHPFCQHRGVPAALSRCPRTCV